MIEREGGSVEPERVERDEQWVRDRFGDVGPAPDNLVDVDEDAPPVPNIERPCEGEVTDDGS